MLGREETYNGAPMSGERVQISSDKGKLSLC